MKQRLFSLLNSFPLLYRLVALSTKQDKLVSKPAEYAGINVQLKFLFWLENCDLNSLYFQYHFKLTMYDGIFNQYY